MLFIVNFNSRMLNQLIFSSDVSSIIFEASDVSQHISDNPLSKSQHRHQHSLDSTLSNFDKMGISPRKMLRTQKNKAKQNKKSQHTVQFGQEAH